MKKRFLNIFLVAGMLLFAPSCSDDFMDLNPSEAVNQDEVFTTVKNGWAAINGLHRLMYQQGGAMDQCGQSAQMIYNDFMGDDVVPLTNQWFVSGTRWLQHVNENSAHVWHRYRFYYQIILNANLIIENMADIAAPEVEKEPIVGQAYAYRAWAHFELVQFYAERYDPAKANNDQLGVPLVLNSADGREGLGRATVQQVYDQIKLDLAKAIELLDGKTMPAGPAQRSHLSAAVARGILARVSMVTGDWATAASMSNAARAGRSLNNHEQMLSGLNSITLPEVMWGSHVIPDHTTFFHSFFAFMSYNFNSTNIRTSPKAINSLLYAQIPDTDIRKQWFEETAASARARLTANSIPTTYSAAPFHSFKFSAVGTTDSRGDVTYMRVAEMFLIEAEALARDGQYAQAAQVLYDLVSTRDSEYTLSTLTGQDLIDEIMIQRRIELWGEGFRWQDLKRTNSNLDRQGTNFNQSVHILLFYPAGGPHWVSLFPRDEINANPKIVQNQH
ncbi:MAG: RagB/SusD family nutrient uptake outer membrane protein [Bacteroidales bacterium]